MQALETSHGQQRNRCRRSPGHHRAAPLARPSKRWQPLCRPRPFVSTRRIGRPALPAPRVWAHCGAYGLSHPHALIRQARMQRWVSETPAHRPGPGVHHGQTGLEQPLPPENGDWTARGVCGVAAAPPVSSLLEWGKGADSSAAAKGPSRFLPDGTRAPRRGRDWSRLGAPLRAGMGHRGETARVRFCRRRGSVYASTFAPARSIRSNGRTSWGRAFCPVHLPGSAESGPRPLGPG